MFNGRNLSDHSKVTPFQRMKSHGKADVFKISKKVAEIDKLNSDARKGLKDKPLS